MRTQYLKNIIRLLLVITLFIGTNLYAEAPATSMAIMKSKIDWIPVYQYDPAAPHEQSTDIIAKFRKDTTYFTLNNKPTNGKYLVYIYDVAILGWVNEQDVEFVPFDSSYRRFSFLMYAYAARTFITGKEVCPFMKYKYIDANTVEISVTNTWNTMQPKYQKKIEEDALTIWVAINYYDDKQPYCIKFMYQEKELATRCSDKAFVKRASENGKTFSLDSFF